MGLPVLHTYGRWQCEVQISGLCLACSQPASQLDGHRQAMSEKPWDTVYK